MPASTTNVEDPDYSEPSYAQRNDTNVPWYLPTINKYLDADAQELLEQYSGIPRDQQSEHVHKIREQAWSVRAYMCTGLGIWLIPYLSRSPAYQTIIKRLQEGGIFMDIGCFVGGDMRKLVFDGAPSDNMYGIDIVSHWDVGFDLYRDRDRFKGKYIEGDILTAPEQSDLQSLRNHVDVISISAVLHQWHLDYQIKGAKSLVGFSKPGTLVVGYQVGNKDAKHVTNKNLKLETMRHTPESMKKMWDDVGEQTGTKWKTEAWLRSWDYVGWDPNDMEYMEPGDCVIEFVVTRLE